MDILPKVEGSAVSEAMAGHLCPTRVKESDRERIHEHSAPGFGQNPLKSVGDANLDNVEVSS